jgi:hypothetical protein
LRSGDHIDVVGGTLPDRRLWERDVAHETTRRRVIVVEKARIGRYGLASVIKRARRCVTAEELDSQAKHALEH